MGQRIAILAPKGTRPSFGQARNDVDLWEQAHRNVARVRAAAYLADGAIKAKDLDSEGGFRSPLDDGSWHLLSLNSNDEVAATIRLTVVPLCIARRNGRIPHIGDSLARSNTQLAMTIAVELFLSEMQLTHGKARPNFFVVSGWASDPQLSINASGAAMALATWGMTMLFACAGGIAIASERHDAHRQLVRTGARQIFPPNSSALYFDPLFGCRVGALGAHALCEAKQFQRPVRRIARKLQNAEVITNQTVALQACCSLGDGFTAA